MPDDQDMSKGLVGFGDDISHKILGIRWNPSTGRLQFEHSCDSEGTSVTKRVILSEASRIFDPLGLLAPFIIAKIILQDTWQSKLGRIITPRDTRKMV